MQLATRAVVTAALAAAVAVAGYFGGLPLTVTAACYVAGLGNHLWDIPLLKFALFLKVSTLFMARC